ncbi:hypothetical protein [Clostridium estertheticum]|uniref:hypothetical protein n=1 Tax=Clostridium estertheticum TaxID=238834 RepID=UPI001C6DFB5C|nr:hypothetical protein [Clostridium estertheticum]MBW9152099.1 hypothetical protein [Clostridium estertheticum]WLC85126.1 hypothetical protein KTC97_05010 [Clostridium estertheticum]
MKIEDSNSEDIDMIEEYDMVPLQSMMYGYDQMNMMSNMGMPMGYMRDMNSNMEMNKYRGINPWMGMGQFNYVRSMNEFNQLGRMYRNEGMDDYEEVNKNKSYIDKYQEQPDIPSMTASPSPQYNEVDSIVKRIERYNPAIFRRLTRYGNPYVEAREIVSRIVKVSLMYRDE